jgi:two-component system, OmpR family, sensor kinase
MSSGPAQQRGGHADAGFLVGRTGLSLARLLRSLRRFQPRTLTNRIVVGVVSLVVLLVLGIGSMTFFALQHFLYGRLDQQLAADADSDHAGFYFSPRFAYRGARPAGDGAVTAVAFDKAGNTVSPNPALASTLTASYADRQRLAGDAGSGAMSITTTTGEQLRVKVVQVGVIQLPSGATEPATVAIGLSSSDVLRILHRLVTLEALIGSGAVFVAFLATTYGVRTNMRGLQTVTRLAWEVSGDVSPEGGGLTKRVPMDDPGVTSEVGQLSFSFNTLLSAVESQVAERARSEQRMRQFLLDASHELRTPLTSIRGYAELARMHRQSGDDGPATLSEIGDNLQRIESEGVRMSRLVDDLLSLARSDEGVELHSQLVEIDELAHDTANSARAAFPDRVIEVDAPPGLVVTGDHDQLRRVLTNLITNAAVHTRPGGPIRVEARRTPGSVIIKVSDSGPGLPPQEAEHVYDRFWRADKSRTRASGGSGLGMSIVAAIVATHHGTTRFDSTVETGSTVTIQLPLPTAPENPNGSTPHV